MIFGKSKEELLKGTQSEVFDIIKVGVNIAKLRKAAGMTQTGLADRLNVSFQAVSNWERGQSCPDIANLMELAKLFGVSVDRILGSERAAELVTDISEEKAPKMSAKEIKEIAPILNETQSDSVVRKNLMSEADRTSDEDGAGSGEEYESLYSVPAALLPYLSDELINELAADAVRTGGKGALPTDWLPFVDEDALGKIAREIMEKDGINAIPEDWLPFIDEDSFSDMVDIVCEKSGIGALPSDWLPYIGEEWIGEQAKKAVEKGGKGALPTDWLPFVDEDALGEIAEEILKKEGIGAIPEDWFPFIDEEILSEYVRKKIKKG